MTLGQCVGVFVELNDHPVTFGFGLKWLYVTCFVFLSWDEGSSLIGLSNFLLINMIVF